MLKKLVIRLAIPVFVPLAMYYVLTSLGTAPVWALVLAGVVPAAASIIGWFRERKLDAIGLTSVFFFALGAISALITQDPKYAFISGAASTALFGIMMLGSLALKRPLISHLTRAVIADTPQAAAKFDEHWQNSQSFRADQRRLTWGWGLALIAESTLRLILTPILPTGEMFFVSTVVPTIITTLLTIWTVRTVHIAWHSLSAEKAAQELTGLAS